MYEKDCGYKLSTCLHCGNTGLLKIEHICRKKFGGPIWDEFGNEVGLDLEEHFTWYVLSCPVCNRISLYQEYQDESSNFQLTEQDTLYPQESFSYRGVPKDIQTAFEAALKVKNIDMSICLLSLRRVLEAICRDKEARGKNLEEMIQNMIERKILPEMLNDACWIIRQLGNSAAHADKQTVYMNQVDQTIDFMKNIIQYLYTLPVEMTELKKKIMEEKTEGKGNANANT